MTIENSQQLPPDNELEKWMTRATILPVVALLGVTAAAIVGAGVVLVGGMIAMSPEQKVQIVQQTADAIPNICLASVGIVGAITGATLYMDRHDARRAAREQLPERRRP